MAGVEAAQCFHAEPILVLKKCREIFPEFRLKPLISQAHIRVKIRRIVMQPEMP